jgi:DNA-binding NarL/FixJ family response regulator
MTSARRTSSRAPLIRALAAEIGLERLAELEVQAVRRRAVPERLMRRLFEPNEPLTPRQREVLVLVASGLSNQEIANELGIAIETVKSHLRNVFARLGVHNRIEAINAFIEGEA